MVNQISRVINKITDIFRWLGLIALMFMMFFITISVVLRFFGYPILGNVELVQFLMVLAIVFGIPYAQKQDAHLYVELVYDKLPRKFQKILLYIVCVISLVTILYFTVTYINVAFNSINAGVKSTLLRIPYYPFKFMIAIGFTLWFLQLLVQILNHSKLKKER